MSFITVVSGLPRSGTSLMMQMLLAGGMRPLTDSVRRADEDNPLGYFEYEPVKSTRRDASWVSNAPGKVVKVIHALLTDLPSGFEYRVILMKRPIGEVLRSQRRMLERAGKAPAQIPQERLARVFEQQLQEAEDRMARRDEFKVLPVAYHDCVYRPAEVSAAVAGFLGIALDAGAMEAAVDPALHRNRS